MIWRCAAKSRGLCWASASRCACASLYSLIASSQSRFSVRASPRYLGDALTENRDWLDAIKLYSEAQAHLDALAQHNPRDFAAQRQIMGVAEKLGAVQV